MIHMLGNILGGVGVSCFLLAFYMLQKNAWKHDSAIYLMFNLVGALLVLCSLWIDWNLSAFVLEAIWALISIWGLIKLYKPQKPS